MNTAEAHELFNGRDLSGWHAIGGGSWTVQNAAIVGRSTQTEKQHGLLISDATYGDFIAEFDYRILEGDSGFYFRVKESGDRVGVHGFQVEVDDVEPGGLYETGGRAWVIKPSPEEAKRWHRSGEWNHVELRAVGGNIDVKINGMLSASLRDDPGRNSGRFALQLHGGQNMYVMFRGIRVQPIEPG